MPVTERKECLRAAARCKLAPAFQRSPDRAQASLLRSRLRAESGGDRLETVDAPHARGNRGLWLKVKCLNRAEFVVVGWTA
jgi:ATP-dependent DNA ligase